MQIFIIFHKFIFDECYIHIPQPILDKYFTFIAVNENIPKIYQKDKYKVINEWELPIYYKSFQERGYNENSAIYHVYANNLHKNYNMIGFFQYDMMFTDNIINYEKNKNVCFCVLTGDYNFCTYDTWGEPTTANFIINNYEKYFGKKFIKEECGPLLNSFVISSDIFEKMMAWVIQLYDKLYPWCVEPPNWSYKGHIGNIYERITAYAISQSNIDCKILNVNHGGNNLKAKSY